MYFIREDDEDDLNLASARYEIPLMIQDRLLNPDGSLQYLLRQQRSGGAGLWVPEFLGDTVLVNGGPAI
jgi:spore coat protein A